MPDCVVAIVEKQGLLKGARWEDDFEVARER